MIFWMPNTSCSPAATRKSTAAWNTPPSTTLANADMRADSVSDFELRGFDPLPEIGAGRLLKIGGIHRLEPVEGHEIVLVVVGAEALGERLVGDVVLAPGAFAAEALDREALHRADDVVERGPAPAFCDRRLFDRRLVGYESEIGAIGLPVRVVLVLLRVPADELVLQGRCGRVGEIEGVVTEQHPFRRERLLHQRVLPTRCREHQLG